MSKSIVENNQLKWAEERGYYVRMMELPCMDATYPKQKLLLGAKRGSPTALGISRLPHFSSSSSSTTRQARTTATQLYAKLEDDDQYESISDKDKVMEGMEIDDKYVDRMDLDGFQNYIAPYAIAFLSSLAVTAAFAKFVLMDY